MTRAPIPAVFAVLAAACATAPAPTPAAAPVDATHLAGTSWRLAVSEGRLDGRTVEFKRAATTYRGVLTRVGQVLTGKVGAHEGLVLLELVPSDRPGSFSGYDRIPGQEENEVICSVSRDGLSMKCNDENTAWIRVP